MTEFINHTLDDFIIYYGDDNMILEVYAQRGVKRISGIISGGSHLIGGQLRNMIEIFLQGKVKEAAEIQQSFLPLFRSWGQNGRFNPCSLMKESMKIVGWQAGIPHLPLTSGIEEEIAEIKRVMKKLNII